MPAENSDRRRRQYVPLVTTFAHGRTAERLIAKFGRDGLLVWVCYLAACKRAPEQGVFEYVSEGEGWGLLGLRGHEPAFTLADFFRTTGQLHKTSRRARGQLTTIACTVWDDITAGYDRELDAARKRRKRGTKTPDTPPTDERQNEDDSRTEYEGEGDSEGEQQKDVSLPAEEEDDPIDEQAVCRIHAHWLEVTGRDSRRYKTISRERRAKIRARMREFTVDDLLRVLDTAVADDWEDRHRFTDFKHLYRSREVVEGWLDRADNPTPTPIRNGRDNGLSSAQILALSEKEAS